jgi:uncharacterized protein YceH (UPF0502 family)
VLAVLMLRGAQTPGELKQRTERMQAFAGLGALQAVLDRLVERELVARLPRRPGQKEERYAHRLSDDAAADAAEAAAAPVAEPAHAAREPAPAAGDGRLARLEAELGALRAELEELRGELAALRSALGG